ncbi:hypothetical protein ACTOB_001397 [Actinoplanes oblitus]|uniref:Phage tail protein n=1 Tax=Actinoplanes oblitus TaxID=3040509 RepID=A0ABY8WMT9_9ACTN|nr:hypothetical protein [Actinoplanes oblitus]WIM97843.1 hypothetical protein ACTOB_001397 [Actinoplanes oblitus]
MSDTSLVFNLLAKDSVSRVLGVIGGAFRSAGQTAEASMEKATVSTARLDRQIEETERDLARLNAEFAETGDKTLFGKITRDRQLLAQLRRVRDEVGRANDEVRRSGEEEGRAEGRMRALASAFSGGVSAVGGFGSTLGSVTSSVWGIVSALLAAAAAAASIGPALALAGGALGSLPGLITGGVAGIGALKLGLFGLGDEYKRLTTATGGGGGGGGATKAAKDFTVANRAVADAVKAVARAERDVRDAQRDALEAQKAINDARETAADRIRDQALDMESAQLDQADAVKELADAQADVDKAKALGDPTALAEAEERYKRAELAVRQVKARLDDLTQATKENTRTGVEGSDEVVQAQKREQDARRRVADSIEAEKEAEQRLAVARKALKDQQAQGASGGGGGGGAGQQITKLAPAARAFLNTILALRPAFEDLRLDVQQAMFAGLAPKLQRLAEVWKNPLHTTLVNYGKTLNGIAKTLFDSVSKKSFVDNLTAGADSARTALDRVGRAVAGPLVDAFGRLARASGPFVEKLGDLIGRTVERFSAWIKSADKSGKLDRFFAGAASTLEKIWTLGGKVVTVMGKVIGIIYPQAKAGGDSALDSANKALDKVSAWLDKPENQQKITNFVAKIGEFGSALRDVARIAGNLGGVVSAAFGLVKLKLEGAIGTLRLLKLAWDKISTGVRWIRDNGPSAWASFKSGLTSAYNTVVDRGGRIVSWVRGLPGRITRASRGMWNGLWSGFRAVANRIIGGWNQLNFTIGGSFMGISVPSASFGTPGIPYLAKGGNITQGGAAVVGEAGPELLNLPRGAQVTPLSGGGGLGGTIVVRLEFPDSEFGRMMTHAVRTQSAVRTTLARQLKVVVTA